MNIKNELKKIVRKLEGKKTRRRNDSKKRKASRRRRTAIGRFAKR